MEKDGDEPKETGADASFPVSPASTSSRVDAKRTAVYPQYFIDALETAGGIAWDGCWRATDAGKAVAAA